MEIFAESFASYYYSADFKLSWGCRETVWVDGRHTKVRTVTPESRVLRFLATKTLWLKIFLIQQTYILIHRIHFGYGKVMSCHRLSPLYPFFKGSWGLLLEPIPAVSGRRQDTPWTSLLLIAGAILGISILLKDTLTRSSVQPGVAGIWTSNLLTTSRPARPAELQPVMERYAMEKRFWKSCAHGGKFSVSLSKMLSRLSGNAVMTRMFCSVLWHWKHLFLYIQTVNHNQVIVFFLPKPDQTLTIVSGQTQQINSDYTSWMIITMCPVV